ncbi:MAG TPA: zinc-dependent metalloprotease [Saprospiraceae bacterium]|nr:zinc-dependent metalloprotease [Saprospiraceae bacterium]
MRISLLPFHILILLSCTGLAGQSHRCLQESRGHPGAHCRPHQKQMQTRSTQHFRLVFHVLHSTVDERIPASQIYSQVEILNDIYNRNPYSGYTAIPAEFRSLQSNPQMQFCLADDDPNGQPTDGINYYPVNDPDLACKTQFGKRNIMHSLLGGVDVWDPKSYINIYIANRESCSSLGEAVFPWEAQADEDGIIIDFRALGHTGIASGQAPFHLGRTLVHELGHFFGLLHLSENKNDCTGDDLVNDTPVQAGEYFGCPNHPQINCTVPALFMNYMSLVDDPCMKLFTTGQVVRMNQMIMQYRSELPGSPCSAVDTSAISELQIIQLNGFWQIRHANLTAWSAGLELYDLAGRLVWRGENRNQLSYTLPLAGWQWITGMYFLRISNPKGCIAFKLIKN